MTFIPDSFSKSDLDEVLSKALDEETEQKKAANPLNPDAVVAVAQEACDLASSKIPDPLVHKCMAVGILNKMLAWHEYVAEEAMKKGDFQRANEWLRDAGKFQAMVNLLFTVSLGEGDFLFEGDDK